METSGSSEDWKTGKICQCCLTRNCYKDLSVEYYCSGQKENYRNILLDTFCIEISLVTETQFICDECIARLRDSSLFKSQVLQSQSFIQNHLEKTVLEKAEILNKESTLDMDTVKQETPDPARAAVDKVQHDMILNHIEGYSSCDDDEILANVKLELEKELNLAVEKSELTKSKKNKLKTKERKAKMRLKRDEKDWMKICERRGNGPLLRENSLS